MNLAEVWVARLFSQYLGPQIAALVLAAWGIYCIVKRLRAPKKPAPSVHPEGLAATAFADLEGVFGDLFADSKPAKKKS